MHLNAIDFFKYFLIHPDSVLLDKKDRTAALVSSVVLGIFTLGLCHLVCAIVFRKYTPTQPKEHPRIEDAFRRALGGAAAPPPPATGSAAPSAPGALVSPHESALATFWQNLYDPKKPALLHLLHMCLTSAGVPGTKLNYSEIATDLVDAYHTAQSDEAIDRTAISPEDEKLIRSVSYNLEHWPQTPASHSPALDDGARQRLGVELPANRDAILPGNRLFASFPTVGDGSCGFHALLGTSTEGGPYTLADIAAKRREFSEFIRTKRRALPPEISNSIIDHFEYFDKAQPAFKKATEARRNALFAGYPCITATDSPLVRKEKIAERERLKQAFLDDDIIFEAYLNQIADPSIWLSQPELIAVAIWQNITLRLIQPSWGGDSDPYAESDPINERAGQEVRYVYYNGNNHFEKAVVIALDAPPVVE